MGGRDEGYCVFDDEWEMEVEERGWGGEQGDDIYI